MHHPLPIVALSLGGSLLLVFAAMHDLVARTVPNWVCAALLGCGLALRIADGSAKFAGIAALLVFLATLLFWHRGWLGGGDVKLLTASAVFVPPALVPTMVLGTALAGGLLALLYLALGRIARPPPAGRPHGLIRRAARAELWRLRRRGPLPYAAAIAAGSLFATLAS